MLEVGMQKRLYYTQYLGAWFVSNQIRALDVGYNARIICELGLTLS